MYFTKINIDVLVVKNPYLEKSPYIILGQIEKDKSLQIFCEVMRDKIQNVEFKKSSYNDQDLNKRQAMAKWAM